MMLRSSLSAIALLALLGACGDKAFAPGTAGEAVGAGELAAGADAIEDPQTLAEDLLDKLKDVQTDEEAVQLEAEIFDTWLFSGSATVDVLMKRGLEYQAAEDLEGARDAFDRAIAIKPEYAEAWNRRAVLFFTDGKYDEAVADLESAIQNEPRHFGAWIGLAMIFEAIDRPDAALRAYEKALEIHPRLQDAIQGKRRLDRLVNGAPL